MNETFASDIAYSIKALDMGNIQISIKEILSSFLSQLKEIKTYDIPILQTNENEVFIGDIEFDFNDMVNIVFYQKNIDVDNLSENDIKKIKDFWNNYIASEEFVKRMSKLVNQFRDMALKKQNVDKLRIKGIGYYFENLKTILRNLQLCYNKIINSKKTIISFTLPISIKKRVVELIYKEAPITAKPDQKINFILDKINEYSLSAAITKDNVYEIIQQAREAKQVKKAKEQEARAERQKQTQKPKSNYPRPLFKGSYKNSKGLTRVINKIFSKPTGYYNIAAYPQTKFAESLNFEFHDGIDNKYFVKPLFDLANELGQLFSSTESLLKHLRIDSEILKTKKATQKNIFLNFYLLDKKLSDFFYKFFLDIKNNGIYYTFNKAYAFYNMVYKITNVYKNSVYNNISNYYTSAKDFLAKSKANMEKIVYFLDSIGINLSGMFVNIDREKRKLESKIKA